MANQSGTQTRTGSSTLLDLGFRIEHVLAHDRVVLFHFKLVRGIAFVLVGRVVMARSGT